MGGPAKRPVELTKLLGNPGKRALPEAGVALPRAYEPPPTPVTFGSIAREAWERIWRVGSAWLSVDTDIKIVQRLCEGYQEEYDLRRLLDDEPRWVEGQRGGLVAHPGYLQLRQLEANITRWESLCGLTPSDRGRLGYAQVKTASKLQEFLERQKRNKHPLDPTGPSGD